MSRQIDPKQPLSDEDRAYLEERNQHSLIARIDGDSFEEHSSTEEPAGDDEVTELQTQPPQYDDHKVDELRVMLLDRELDDRGTKSELVARLEEDDASKDEGDE